MAFNFKEQCVKAIAVCAGLLAAFFMTACGVEFEPSPEYLLQGTWVSNDSGAVYSGKLVIDYGQIKITGYSDQTPVGDDSKRPFKNFTRGVELKYRLEVTDQKKDTMEGIIYITDKGKEQEGIPFFYWEGDSWETSSIITDKFLSFTFGGREEILENKENHHDIEDQDDDTD